MWKGESELNSDWLRALLNGAGTTDGTAGGSSWQSQAREFPEAQSLQARAARKLSGHVQGQMQRDWFQVWFQST